jgi:DNA polymerase-3 subunit epsilon
VKANWLSRLLTSRSDTTGLDIALRETLSAWQSTPPADDTKSHFETRYVVLNTESSGLDAERDRLLSVGAIALASGTIVAEDSYYAEMVSDAATVLVNLLTFAASGPVVVYSAGLNKAMLERALDEHLGITPDWIWLDLYWLLPALFPERIARPTRLVEWMHSFGIETFQRHHALGDAYAIAQLMLAAEGRATRRGLSNPKSLAELERRQRRLLDR